MKQRLFTGLVVGFWSIMAAMAKVTLPAIFSDNMVLQQGKSVRIWGKADAGERITVRFCNQKRNTIADTAGNWSVTLAPMKADNRPRQLVVKGASDRVVLSNILVGEVWLASGQSNMEYSMHNHPRFAKPKKGDPDRLEHEYLQASNHQIRVLYVKRDLKQEDLPTDGWHEAMGEALAPISAAAYFFAKELQNSLNVPVGIISSSWGGTPIESWIPKNAYRWSSFYADERNRCLENNETPGRCYDKMIAPLVPLALRGFLWYQGEANLIWGETDIYEEKMTTLIDRWRKVFGDADLPFYYVQLSPYAYSHRRKDRSMKTIDDLPRFWQAQTACLKIPNTGMVVTTDLPEDLYDIHPSYKWTVGERLSKWALHHTYGKKQIAYSGPSFKSMDIQGNRIVLSFDHTENGLMTRDGKSPSYFSVMKTNGRFVEVTARIENNRVVLEMEGLARPAAVRFAWDEAAQPNLVNREGLPAVPFEAKEEPAFYVAKYKDNKRCAVSYTFDDGLLDGYTDIFPHLKELGLKGTFVIWAKCIENDTMPFPEKPRMTWAQMREMQADGQEIGCHSWSHPNFTRISYAEIRRELEMNDSAIYRHLGIHPRSFAYPGNAYDNEIDKIVAQNKVVTRRYQFNIGGEKSKTTPADLDRWLQRLLATGGWGIGMTHAIRRGYDRFDHPEILWNHWAKVAAMQDSIWVGTFAEVGAYVKECDAVKLDIQKVSDGWEITPRLTLSPRLYDQWLTLVVNLPNRTPLCVRQDGKSLEIRNAGNRRLLCFNPHGGTIVIKEQTK